jgi:hypothetical protein
VTDRDHFAAAALAGLLGSCGHHGSDHAPKRAYELADAMLRERGQENHDAAPPARAQLPEADHAACRSRESDAGTGGTQEPVAWAVENPAGDIHTIAYRRDRAEDYLASASERVVPLYRHPQPALTEAEQLAVAWAAREADEWDEEDTPEIYAHAEVLAGLFRRLT